MRFVVVIALIALGLPAAAASLGSASRVVPTVPCNEDIGHPRSGHEAGYRVVLGVVSVPPAYLRQVVATHKRPWAYWRKAGLVVWSAATVTVTVPEAWRNRAAISWGNTTPIVSLLRFSPCTRYFGVKGWDAFAGGFFLRSRSACVPLVFRVGQRSATARFGIGRTCRAAQ